MTKGMWVLFMQQALELHVPSRQPTYLTKREKEKHRLKSAFLKGGYVSSQEGTCRFVCEHGESVPVLRGCKMQPRLITSDLPSKCDRGEHP